MFRSAARSSTVSARIVLFASIRGLEVMATIFMADVPYMQAHQMLILVHEQPVIREIPALGNYIISIDQTT